LPRDIHPISHTLEIAFIGLQIFNVIFLLFHDWIPLGSLNNLAAIRGQDSLMRRVFVTLLAGVPAAICLYLSAQFFGQPYPLWVELWLWITYGLLFLGLLRAWWIPYLVLEDAPRAARYQTIFAGTHSFLPRHNGIAPDTLHTLFHLAIAATLVLLIMRDLRI
jgi:hypothetical protein